VGRACHDGGGWLDAGGVYLAGDAVNPLLRLWYGPSEAPVAELNPPILVNMVLYG
jgi:hypothetical protein